MSNFTPDILIASRTLGALLFATAALGKLRHREEFVGIVRNYRIGPSWLSPFVATAIPPLEAGTALALALVGGPVAGAVAVGLLAVFTVAVVINLLRGNREIDCGCFQSALRQRLNYGPVLRNIFLLALLLPGLATTSAPPSPFDIINGVAAGLAVFLIQLAASALLAANEAAEALRRRTL